MKRARRELRLWHRWGWREMVYGYEVRALCRCLGVHSNGCRGRPDHPRGFRERRVPWPAAHHDAWWVPTRQRVQQNVAYRWQLFRRG